MKTPLIALFLGGALTLTGCATYDQPYSSNGSNGNSYYGPSSPTSSSDYRYERQGRIESIQYLGDYRRSNASPATGAVVGAVVGGIVGNQFGSGRGKTAATVGGAAVGGVVGNNIQRNNEGASARSEVEVRVRLNNGEQIRVVQPDYGDRFYTGQQVRVVGYGNDIRIYAN